jgi:VWFA-related protein
LPAFLLAGQFEIKIDVSRVSVDVEVSDSGGRAVTNLTQDDFVVLEDGHPQQLRYFGSADSPYDLVLLFDCSDSTAKEAALFDQAAAAMSKYKKATDRTLIAAFGQKVQVIRDWNANKDKKLERNTVCVTTRFFDAMSWAIQRLNGQKARKGVVVLTDGADDSTLIRNGQIADPSEDRAFQKIVKTVKNSRVPFYFVAVGTDLNPSASIPPNLVDAAKPSLKQLRSRMEQLAEVSGGDVVFPKKLEDVLPIYERIGRKLGTSYSLAYAPPTVIPDGKRHTIEVRLKSQVAALQLKQSRNAYTSK